MKWLLKNLGLAALGLCILCATATLADMRMADRKALERNTAQIAALNACQPVLASELLHVAYKGEKHASH